nr:MAG TPA: hypothetical protein [Caudoviricetes sp.]
MISFLFCQYCFYNFLIIYIDVLRFLLYHTIKRTRR